MSHFWQPEVGNATWLPAHEVETARCLPPKFVPLGVCTGLPIALPRQQERCDAAEKPAFSRRRNLDRHGRIGMWQDDHRKLARTAARMAIPGCGLVSSALQRRQNA